MTRINPYQGDTFEHALWESWNRDFFQQPVHAQILEIENQLREQVHALSHLIQEMEAGRLRRQMTDCILALESHAEDLSEIAEHQFLAVVSRETHGESGTGQSN